MSQLQLVITHLRSLNSINYNDDEEMLGVLCLIKSVVSDVASKNKLLFDAIPPNVLKTVFHNNSTEEKAQICKNVAISILSELCNNQDLAIHPNMITHVHKILEIVFDNDNFSIHGSAAIKHAYSWLQKISQYPPGRQILIDNSVIQKLCEIYLTTSIHSFEVLKLLTHLMINKRDFWTDADPALYHDIMNKMAVHLETNYTEMKVKLCTILQIFLSFCPKNTTWQSQAWPETIYRAAKDMLSTNTRDNEQKALLLTSTVLNLFGTSWLVSENKPEFFFLVVYSALKEIFTQLVGKPYEVIRMNSEIIIACLLILEMTLMTEKSRPSTMELEERHYLAQNLGIAFQAMHDTLVLALPFVAEITEPAEQWCLCLMVGLLTAWPTKLKTPRCNVDVVLLIVLRICKDYFRAQGQRQRVQLQLQNLLKSPIAVDNRHLLGEIDILATTLPMLSTLIIEKRARQIFLQLRGDLVVFECLEHHWNIVQWQPLMGNEDSDYLDMKKKSRQALMDISFICMVIVAEYSADTLHSSILPATLDFIFNNLANLRRIWANVTLYCHLTLLGLNLVLIMKKYEADQRVARHICAATHFFYRCLELTGDTWEKIAKMWHLGMNILPVLALEMPWFLQSANQSGWARNIVQLLTRVENCSTRRVIKPAYERLLCRLVNGDQETEDALKNCGLLDVCRDYQMMELAKYLCRLYA